MNELGQDRLRSLQLLHDVCHVQADAVVHRIPRAALGLFHPGPDGVHEAVNVIGFPVAVHSRLHGSTALVTEHDDQRGLEVFNSVLDAADHAVVRHIARHSNRKQVAEPLVEDHLRAHPRIRATENDCEGMLSELYFVKAIQTLIRMLRLSGHTVLVALDQPGQRFVSCEARLVLCGETARRGISIEPMVAMYRSFEADLRIISSCRLAFQIAGLRLIFKTVYFMVSPP